MNRLTLLLSIVVLGIGLASPAMAESDSDGATDAREVQKVVEALQSVLVECMKGADALGFDGRSELVSAQLPKSFDLPFVARTGIGPLWKDLTPEQHREFIDVSRRLTAARYAENFDGYGGERFDTLEVVPAARGTYIVKTELVLPKKDNVHFDYRLRNSPVGWRIIDVVIEGSISEFVIWRSQYRDVIEDEGYVKLIETMENKIKELAAE